MSFLELLRKLVYTPGVSGYEERIRNEILSIAKKYGKVSVDSIGNVILELGEGSPSILFAAHMDELGLVVTNIEDDGLIRFRKIGGIDDRILASQHVVIHSEKGDIPGIIGLTPPHLKLEKEVKVLPWNELAIDVGASSRSEVEEWGVRILDPVTFAKPWSLLRRGEVLATRSIDDRFGCAILLELARNIYEGKVKPRGKVYLAWTVQEEVGLRGALALSHTLRPDYAVSVDTTSCCNPVITGTLAPGKGPTIRFIDNAAILNPRLVRYIVGLAEANGVKLQLVSAGGGTDAAAFQRANVNILALGVATKYTHSTVEMASINDMMELLRLLSIIVEDGFRNYR